MKIVNVFDDNGKTLQDIMEQFLVDYCLEIGSFKK